MEKIGKGRAEYQSNIEDCFEGVPARYIFAPHLLDYHPKLIIGDRGVGKTHLIKLLSKDVPVKTYDLDKEGLYENRLRWRVTSPEEKPLITIVDDVHYLLKFMQLARLEYGIDCEESVLRKLEWFKERAEKQNSILFYVADESPAGLMARFEDDENKKKFLMFFKGCLSTSDDAQVFYHYFKEDHSLTNKNILDLNYRGYRSLSASARKDESLELKAKFFPLEGYINEFVDFKGCYSDDFSEKAIFYKTLRSHFQNHLKDENFDIGAHLESNPLEFPEILNLSKILRPVLKDESIDEFRKILLEKKNGLENDDYGDYNWGWLNDSVILTGKRIVKSFNMKDIPFIFATDGYRSSLFNLEDGYIDCPHNHQIVIYNNSFESYYGRKEFIAKFRELKVVSDKVGGINREALNLRELGQELKDGNDRPSIAYTREELRKIQKKINDIYHEAINYNPLDLINDLFYGIDSDKEAHSVLIKHQLALE